MFLQSIGIKFTWSVHEQMKSSLIENKYSTIESNIEITHLGYNFCESKPFEKAERNIYLRLEKHKLN